jgi:hypothetical protein
MFSRVGRGKGSASREKHGTYNCQPQVQMQAVADRRQHSYNATPLPKRRM